MFSWGMVAFLRCIMVDGWEAWLGLMIPFCNESLVSVFILNVGDWNGLCGYFQSLSHLDCLLPREVSLYCPFAR